MVIRIIGAGYVRFTNFNVLARANWSEGQEKMSDNRMIDCRNRFLDDTSEQNLNVIGVIR